MLTQIGFGAFLVFVAYWLFRLQRKMERAIVPDESGAHGPGAHDDPVMVKRRKSRRTIVSLMIGLVGCCMMIGAMISSLLIFSLLWLGVIGVVLGITWLGFVDLISTRRHVRELRQRHKDEREKLQSEVTAAIEDLRGRRSEKTAE